MMRIFNENHLVTLDSTLTFVPFVSTIVCSVNIIAKATFLHFISYQTIASHPYLTHLKLKNYEACAWGLIPMIGNIALAIIIARGLVSVDISESLQDLGPDTPNTHIMGS